MDLKKAEQKILEFNANTQISVDFRTKFYMGNLVAHTQELNISSELNFIELLSIACFVADINKRNGTYIPLHSMACWIIFQNMYHEHRPEKNIDKVEILENYIEQAKKIKKMLVKGLVVRELADESNQIDAELSVVLSRKMCSLWHIPIVCSMPELAEKTLSKIDFTVNKFPPEVITVLAAINATGHIARVAGGAVRDIVWGKTPADYDVATTALPHEVIDIFKSMNYNVLETGLQHGTVTIMVNNLPIEVTTLRIDTNTDGRHAEVEFTDDWRVDASRRDFTINAMYMDVDGNIHDFFNGIADLHNTKISFVGDPVQRMEEDYLRILRFFRFSARMGKIYFDKPIMQAIAKCSEGLEKISGERIWSEMKKILVTSDGLLLNDITRYMALTDVNKHIELPDKWLTVRNSNLPRNPVTMLALLLINENQDIYPEMIIERWKLSNQEKKILKYLFWWEKSNRSSTLSHLKAVAIDDRDMAIELARMYNSHVDEIITWQIPKFPIDGNALKSIGFKSGKELGDTLAYVKARWIGSDYTLDRTDLLKMARMTLKNI